MTAASTSKKEVDEDLRKYVENKVPCLVIANKVDLVKSSEDIPKEHLTLLLKTTPNISEIKKVYLNYLIKITSITKV
jgi:serine kinase of HPr protein (carbohydrate metabolism regulator)